MPNREITLGLLERLVLALETLAASTSVPDKLSPAYRFPNEMPIIDFVHILKETTKNGVWCRTASLCQSDKITTVGQLREAFPTIHRAPNIGLHTTAVLADFLRETI